MLGCGLFTKVCRCTRAGETDATRERERAEAMRADPCHGQYNFEGDIITGQYLVPSLIPIIVAQYSYEKTK